MTIISAQFKIFVKFDFDKPLKSKIQLQALHNKSWKPVFEFTAADMLKLTTKKRRRK